MYSSQTRVHIFKDWDSDAKDSDLNPEVSDSDSSPQDLDSVLAHYIDLSHITSRIERVCLREFSGRLVSIFPTPLLFSVPTVSVSVLRPGTVGTVSGSVKAIHVTNQH